MIKDITYSGISTVPSDYEAPDGSLAASFNIIAEDNHLRPIPSPSVVHHHIPIPLKDSPRFVFLHKTVSSSNLIALPLSDNSETPSISEGILYWRETGEDQRISHSIPFDIAPSDRFHSITAVGNILVLALTSSIRYFFLKGNSYIYLGSSIPQIDIAFSTAIKTISKTEPYPITLSQKYPALIPGSGAWSTHGMLTRIFTPEDKITVSNAAFAQINTAVAEQRENGCFCFPFFIRYAIKLYDGSLVCHSAPVLVDFDNELAVYISSNGSDEITMRYTVAPRLLRYTILNTSLSHLDPWKDLIAGIAIYASTPCTDVDFDGTVESFGQPSTSGRNLGSPLNLPTKEFDFSTVSNFYLIKEIPIDDLKLDSTVTLEIKKGTPSTLATRLPMTDDYISRCSISARSAFSYNSRLNLAALQIAPFIGYDPRTFNALSSSQGSAPEDSITSMSWAVHISDLSGGDGFVAGDTVQCSLCKFWTTDSNGTLWASRRLFFFYPLTDASDLYIKCTLLTGDSIVFKIKLTPHDFLNGAYAFFDVYDGGSSLGRGRNPYVALAQAAPFATVDSFPDTSMQAKKIWLNKLFVSEVNNPFVFPPSYAVTVGSDEIIAVSSAARPLSQGQFGQFPLYAFTSEGIWAIEVSDKGTYLARQPLARDILISPHALAQLDSSVIFASARGIMLLSGSSVSCLSDILDAPSPQLSTTPPCHVFQRGVPTPQLHTFLPGCRFAYDYIHQRVVIFRSDLDVAYVLSLKSHQWAMMGADFIVSLNSYPEALILNSNGDVVDLCAESSDYPPGSLITRPLKLDAPDILKTVDTVIQRGHFRRGHVQSIFYGSRDLFNWHLVWSSKDHCLRGFRGTPYKYFRIALICNLAPDESIYGASLQFTPRQTNRPH